jgi:hypothetical protein
MRALQAMPFEHKRAIALHCSNFISEGPEVTKKFLAAFSAFGKWWAETVVDFKYYGALAAAEHFKRPTPAIS